MESTSKIPAAFNRIESTYANLILHYQIKCKCHLQSSFSLFIEPPQPQKIESIYGYLYNTVNNKQNLHRIFDLVFNNSPRLTSRHTSACNDTIWTSFCTTATINLP